MDLVRIPLGNRVTRTTLLPRGVSGLLRVDLIARARSCLIHLLTFLPFTSSGGSLQFGNAGQHAYDGSWFATYEDVIVVTVNYRTNGKHVSGASRFSVI